MVEYPDLQEKNILEIEPKYYNNLNIDGFSKMMKSPSYCYKFYWLEAIIQLISEGKTESTFDVMEVQEIRDVFTGQPVKKKKYDIDHFIPWSFVMNDELWNLMPMDASLNSSKSNRLPKWNPFFQNFAQNQYLMYQMIYDDMGIYKRFKGCYKDNLHSIWAGQELYRKGDSKEMFYNILEKNMIPVYNSARRQGYEIWDYS